MQRVIPNARGSDQGPLCRCGSVRVWSMDAGGNPSDLTGAPNTSFQPTASRARSFGFEYASWRARAAAERHRSAPVVAWLPFLFAVIRRSRLWNVRSGVPVLVVLGVVRRPGVPVARYARCGTHARYADCPWWALSSCAARGSDCGPLCAGRDSRWAWFRPNARRAGVIRGWYGRPMREAIQA